MKIVTVLGTRPQFIKAALLSNNMKNHDIEEIIIHTGQHYDDNMSNIFFKDLKLPIPKYNLNLGALSHSEMTGQQLIIIEKILNTEKPDAVIVYGDCNTTLSGALSAVKLNIPVIHIESGLRSYDKSMPEEINRRIVDHISNLLFCPTKNSVSNLHNEGIYKDVYLCSDLMIELIDRNMNKIYNNCDNIWDFLSDKCQTIKNGYFFMTLHRQSNTEPLLLNKILNQIGQLPINIVYPIHPRTKNIINNHNIDIPTNIILIEPQSHINTLTLIHLSEMVITDSGGVQKEAFHLSTYCVTLRDTTEWIETIDSGKNILLDPTNNIDNLSDIIINHYHNNIIDENCIEDNYYQHEDDNMLVEDYILHIIKRKYGNQ